MLSDEVDEHQSDPLTVEEDGPPTAHTDPLLDPGNDTSVGLVTAPGRKLRWGVLALSCSLLFGNFYAYDNPAALNTQMQQYLEMPYEEYQYLLSALYAAYSVPNTILPFIWGGAIDRFGANRVLLGLGAMVCAGQALFALAAQKRWVAGMIAGRCLFGIGGEGVSVAQAAITTNWFRGRELAFALGVNLCVARLGSVANSNITPWIEHISDVPTAIWYGFLACLISFMTSLFLVGCVGTDPARHRRHSHGDSPEKASSKPFRLADLCTLSNWTSTIRHYVAELSDLPTTFWLLCVLTVLLYGTVIPFNNIASDFLQSKWFPGDARLATRIMSIPDTIGAILVAPLGLLVDRYGRRASVLILCAAIIAVVHLLLGLTHLHPVVAFLMLGLAYSAYGCTLWPGIACVVTDERRLGAAYGLATSCCNLALTVMPTIVATIRVVGGSFLPVEGFFVCMTVAGIAVAWALLRADAAYGGGRLERPEIEVGVVAVQMVERDGYVAVRTDEREDE